MNLKELKMMAEANNNTMAWIAKDANGNEALYIDSEKGEARFADVKAMAKSFQVLHRATREQMIYALSGEGQAPESPMYGGRTAMCNVYKVML